MRNLAAILAGAALLAVSAGAVAAPAKTTGMNDKKTVQTAVANGQFTMLVSLVKQAGLAGALSGKGPLTVFAPTDAAFAKVPKATLAALGKDKAKLKAVLLYHVVKGKVMAADVVGMTSATSVQGSPIAISVKDGKVYLNDTAQIVTTDIATSNGVIHVIDTVILPPTK